MPSRIVNFTSKQDKFLEVSQLSSGEHNMNNLFTEQFIIEMIIIKSNELTETQYVLLQIIFVFMNIFNINFTL